MHEFAHAIHDTALQTLDPTLDERLKKHYKSAKAKGLWADKYAAANRHGYWAAAVQSSFGNNREPDHDHNLFFAKCLLRQCLRSRHECRNLQRIIGQL